MGNASTLRKCEDRHHVCTRHLTPHLTVKPLSFLSSLLQMNLAIFLSSPKNGLPLDLVVEHRVVMMGIGGGVVFVECLFVWWESRGTKPKPLCPRIPSREVTACGDASQIPPYRATVPSVSQSHSSPPPPTLSSPLITPVCPPLTFCSS